MDHRLWLYMIPRIEKVQKPYNIVHTIRYCRNTMYQWLMGYMGDILLSIFQHFSKVDFESKF